jgi:hypothetical protein
MTDIQPAQKKKSRRTISLINPEIQIEMIAKRPERDPILRSNDEKTALIVHREQILV